MNGLPLNCKQVQKGKKWSWKYLKKLKKQPPIAEKASPVYPMIVKSCVKSRDVSIMQFILYQTEKATIVPIRPPLAMNIYAPARSGRIFIQNMDYEKKI